MIVVIAPPTMPPSWQTQGWDHHRWVLWAQAYGQSYADLCEAEDRRLGLSPALSAAARRKRAGDAGLAAMRYRTRMLTT